MLRAAHRDKNYSHIKLSTFGETQLYKNNTQLKQVYKCTIDQELLLHILGTGKSDKVETTLTNTTKRSSTTTKPTTTTTTTTTTTDGSASRCHDVNERRWMQTAMQQPTADRPRSYRPYHALLNHRPSSTVLDAIRAIEARQLPPSDQSDLTTRMNGDCCRSVVDRRAGCRLLDIVGRLEPTVGSMRMIQPLRINTMCPQGHVRSQDLGQGRFDGQFGRICC